MRLSCWVTGSIVIWLCTTTVVNAQAQQTRAFSDFEFSQYIETSDRSPQSILQLDNNGVIVLFSRTPHTEQDLKNAGIAYSQSQLALLKAYRLLNRRNDTLMTAFPIFDETQTVKLRGYTSALASDLAGELAADIKTLRDILKREHREANGFTIFFSYVMDRLVWRIWNQQGTLPKRKITADNPFWAGEVWAVYPPRKFSCGTNTISGNGVALCVNWSKSILPKMAPFVSDWQDLGTLFDDYVKYRRVQDPQARKVFEPFNLFDQNGDFTVPVISEATGDSLSDDCSGIANHLSTLVLSQINLPKAVRTSHFRDEHQALVILYHELMWDLLGELDHRGILTKPAAFADPSHARQQDIGDLVFIIQEKN